MSSPASVQPASTVLQTTEILTYTFDFTQVLLPGETIATATSSLIDTTNGGSVPVSLADSPTIVNIGVGTSNGIKQILRGTALVAAHTYRLVVNGQVTATEIWSGPLVIYCPY